jgi:hypothetical protein
VLVVLVLGGIAAWWFTQFERVEEEIDLPLRGEARYNPLFALKRTLQQMDVDVRSRARLSLPAMKLRPGDAVVLASDVRTLSSAQVDALLAWVDDGGHLVLTLPPSDKGRPGELLEALGISVRTHSSCMTWREGEDAAGRWCTNRRFVVDDADTFDWLWGNDDDGYVFGRYAVGAGSLFVAAEFERCCSACGRAASASARCCPRPPSTGARCSSTCRRPVNSPCAAAAASRCTSRCAGSTSNACSGATRSSPHWKAMRWSRASRARPACPRRSCARR